MESANGYQDQCVDVSQQCEMLKLLRAISAEGFLPENYDIRAALEAVGNGNGDKILSSLVGILPCGVLMPFFDEDHYNEDYV
jgi:hypothetical protein